MTNEKQPILSICIPTYNRADILRNNLEIISEQLNENRTNEVEIIVSDNCSPDITREVAANMQKLGLPIVYNRNAENIGADGNFLKCMTIASGKYVYYRDGFKVILRNNDYILCYEDKEIFLCKKDEMTTRYIRDIANTDIDNILRNERMKSWKTTILNI